MMYMRHYGTRKLITGKRGFNMAKLLTIYVLGVVGFMLLNWLVSGIFYLLYGEIEEDEE